MKRARKTTKQLELSSESGSDNSSSSSQSDSTAITQNAKSQNPIQKIIKTITSFEDFTRALQTFRVQDIKDAIKALPHCPRGWSGLRKVDLLNFLLKEVEIMLERLRMGITVTTKSVAQFFQRASEISLKNDARGARQYLFNMVEFEKSCTKDLQPNNLAMDNHYHTNNKEEPPPKRTKSEVASINTVVPLFKLQPMEKDGTPTRLPPISKIIQETKVPEEERFDLLAFNDPFLTLPPYPFPDTPLRKFYLNHTGATSVPIHMPILQVDDRVILRSFKIQNVPSVNLGSLCIPHLTDGTPVSMNDQITMVLEAQKQVPPIDQTRYFTVSRKKPLPQIGWPSSTGLFINEMRISQPSQYSGLLDITKYLRSGLLNTFQMHHDPAPFNAHYLMVVNVMKALPWKNVLKKIPVKSNKECREFVEKTFSGSSDVLQVSHRICLLDPFGRSRIKTPCRGNSCVHLSVFDLEIYLELNHSQRNWSCPHCSKQVMVDSLYIDSYFQQILASMQPCDSSEVNIHNSGTWVFDKKTEDSDDESNSDSDEPTSPSVHIHSVVDLTDD